LAAALASRTGRGACGASPIAVAIKGCVASFRRLDGLVCRRRGGAGVDDRREGRAEPAL